MLDVVYQLHQNFIEKSRCKEFEWGSRSMGDSENAGERLRQEEESNDSSSIFEKMGSQTPMNVIFKRSERGDACQEIALFFYNNGIPFNVAKSVEFKRILELVAKHGVRFKPLTYHEIRVKYLKQQVEKTN